MACSVSFMYFAGGHLGKDKRIAQEILPAPKATRQKMVSGNTEVKTFSSLDRNESGKINCCFFHKNFLGPASLGWRQDIPECPLQIPLLLLMLWSVLSTAHPGWDSRAVPLRDCRHPPVTAPDCLKQHQIHQIHQTASDPSSSTALCVRAGWDWDASRFATDLLSAFNSSSSWWRGREMKRSDRSESCLDSCLGELTG